MSARFAVASAGLMRGAARLLDGISFSAGAGEFVSVAGPNGAGKTSLMRLLAGLEPPTTGSAQLDGAELARMKPRERARLLAYLPQARPLHAAIDVEALVALGRYAYGSTSKLDDAGRAAVERAMAATNVAPLRSRGAATLSGGELARAHLARALAAETSILVADEPVAALDPPHQLAVMRLLREKADAGGLVVAALHEVALARRFCTRIVFLKDGRIAADGPPETALAEACALYNLRGEDAQLLWG
jgi:iron complex transport system ATP-binding protein